MAVGLDLFPATKQTLDVYAAREECSPWRFSREDTGSDYFKCLKQVRSNLAPATLCRIWGAKVQMAYQGKEEILSLGPWRLADAQFYH